MNPEIRKQAIEALQRGEELPSELLWELFPPEKREPEYVYAEKEREEDILANTLSVPLQLSNVFGNAEGAWSNQLIFGDNLQAMKTLLQMKEDGHLVNSDGSKGVRLIYIDPPFATRRDFAGAGGAPAFSDRVAGARFLEFLRKRLVMMRELLSETGSIYVHLDWKRQAHVRVLMDEIFGEQNFRNEIYWYYYNKMPDARKGVFPRATDTILFYVKNANANYAFNPLEEARDTPVKQLMRKKVAGKMINARDADGNLMYQTRTARVVDNVWRIRLLPPADKSENLGFPTQKPEELVARVIEASSDPNDIVLDAFAGSGTTLAVAEKLGRRWIGIDVGKLSIYTVQKRFFNLRSGVGNAGEPITPRPFSVYNAGLYDFSSLRTLPWREWRFFALSLFGCRDEPHTIGGLSLDGFKQGASVLVFDHINNPGRMIDEDTVADIHSALDGKIGRKFFIIAPRGVFAFQQDYLELNGVRYYALRIPYSFINELHSKRFTALQQPVDETAINHTVDAVGFDFIQPPQVEWELDTVTRPGQLFAEVRFRIKAFESRARVRGEDTRGGLESLAMVLLDFDHANGVFVYDHVLMAQELAATGYEAWFPAEQIGGAVMAVFVDIYGNEARQVIARPSEPSQSKRARAKRAGAKKTAKKRSGKKR